METSEIAYTQNSFGHGLVDTCSLIDVRTEIADSIQFSGMMIHLEGDDGEPYRPTFCETFLNHSSYNRNGGERVFWELQS